MTANPAQPSNHEPSLSIAEALGASGRCGVLFADPATRTARATAEAAEVLGWGGQWLPQAPYDLIPVALAQLINASSSSSPWEGEVQLAGGAKGTRTVHARLVPASGSAVIVILRDATTHRLFLEHLEQVDRLVSAGTLASSMAHEIKNALVAGRTLAELLLEKHPGLELADLVRREINRIDAIVGRMLRFARPSQPVFASVSVHEVLEQSRQLVQPKLQSNRVSFEAALNASPDLVSGDVDELQQVFVNLLLNAAEAMDGGGKISVTTELAPGEPNRGPWLSIRVSDSGSGIPPESRESLFKPFFTTKSRGTGLGLAITQKIVQRHQGTIFAENSPGPGATFVVLLPALKPGA